MEKRLRKMNLFLFLVAIPHRNLQYRAMQALRIKGSHLQAAFSSAPARNPFVS